MLQNELFVGQLFLANCWIKRFKTICFIPHKRNYHNYFKTIKIKGRAIFCLQLSILSAFSSVSLWTLKASIEAIVNGISFGLIFLTFPANFWRLSLPFSFLYLGKNMQMAEGKFRCRNELNGLLVEAYICSRFHFVRNFEILLYWPFRNSTGDWGEFQILTNR